MQAVAVPCASAPAPSISEALAAKFAAANAHFAAMHPEAAVGMPAPAQAPQQQTHMFQPALLLQQQQQGMLQQPHPGMQPAVNGMHPVPAAGTDAAAAARLAALNAKLARYGSAPMPAAAAAGPTAEMPQHLPAVPSVPHLGMQAQQQLQLLQQAPMLAALQQRAHLEQMQLHQLLLQQQQQQQQGPNQDLGSLVAAKIAAANAAAAQQARLAAPSASWAPQQGEHS